jgi:hypothetical protein
MWPNLIYDDCIEVVGQHTRAWISIEGCSAKFSRAVSEKLADLEAIIVFGPLVVTYDLSSPESLEQLLKTCLRI